MVSRAFGKLDLSSPLPLRCFEVYFEIQAREGSNAWISPDPNVQNLLNHLKRFTRSYSSREKYLQVLRRFCQWSSHTPSQLAALGKIQIEQLVQQFIDDLAALDRSPTYLNSLIKRLKTFFRINGIEDLKVATYFVPTRSRTRVEYIPSKSEVFAMASAAGSLKNRALILTLWTSGVRISTLCALDYGDVAEELESEDPYIQISVYPEMKERVPDACKGLVPYYTFISPEAGQALRTYLQDREEKYGQLSNQHPLFHSEWSFWDKHKRSGKRLGRRGVAQVVKRSARLAGIQHWRNVTPHTLRKAFESLLTSPTIDGRRLDKATQEFFMGHILPGSQDTYYDKTRIDFHRREYAKLDFSKGVMAKEVRDKLINLTELESHLEDGWQFVAKISDSKSIVRRSAS